MSWFDLFVPKPPMATTQASTGMPPAEDLDTYIPGFQYAESRGERDPWKAVGDQGKAQGAFQFWPIMYKDIQQSFPDEWGQTDYQHMLASPENQVEAMRDGIRMLLDKYHFSGDKMISAWKTGPTAARKGVYDADYVKTVREGMRRGGNPVLNQFIAKTKTRHPIAKSKGTR